MRSYVLRQGRMTAAQQLALEQQWARYGVDVPIPMQPLDWQTLFGRQAPVTLEIGFGNGETLLHLAHTEPDQLFVGVEVHGPGVGHLLHQAAVLGLDNLKVIRGDASALLQQAIPPASLARIMIFFPDPWPKLRHHKRRLVQPPLVAQLAQALKPGGDLYLATDWQDYAAHQLQVLCAESRLDNLYPAEAYAPRASFRPVTRFEQRGLRLGHGVWELHFRRNNDPEEAVSI